jgi:hypothetical protein
VSLLKAVTSRLAAGEPAGDVAAALGVPRDLVCTVADHAARVEAAPVRGQGVGAGCPGGGELCVAMGAGRRPQRLTPWAACASCSLALGTTANR